MPNLTNKPNKNKLLKGISIYFKVMRIYRDRVRKNFKNFKMEEKIGIINYAKLQNGNPHWL
jgi:hypothetical protein